jgi:hypothetical protein
MNQPRRRTILPGAETRACGRDSHKRLLPSANWSRPRRMCQALRESTSVRILWSSPRNCDKIDMLSAHYPICLVASSPTQSSSAQPPPQPAFAMQILPTIALLAAAVQCAQAAPERKLLRTGYDSPIDFSTITGSTAGDATAALSSITNLLPSSGTSGVFPVFSDDGQRPCRTELPHGWQCAAVDRQLVLDYERPLLAESTDRKHWDWHRHQQPHGPRGHCHGLFDW